MRFGILWVENKFDYQNARIASKHNANTCTMYVGVEGMTTDHRMYLSHVRPHPTENRKKTQSSNLKKGERSIGASLFELIMGSFKT